MQRLALEEYVAYKRVMDHIHLAAHVRKLIFTLYIVFIYIYFQIQKWHYIMSYIHIHLANMLSCTTYMCDKSLCHSSVLGQSLCVVRAGCEGTSELVSTHKYWVQRCLGYQDRLASNIIMDRSTGAYTYTSSLHKTIRNGILRTRVRGFGKSIGNLDDLKYNPQI